MYVHASPSLQYFYIKKKMQNSRDVRETRFFNVIYVSDDI